MINSIKKALYFGTCGAVGGLLGELLSMRK
jgi:hypothetical protein